MDNSSASALTNSVRAGGSGVTTGVISATIGAYAPLPPGDACGSRFPIAIVVLIGGTGGSHIAGAGSFAAVCAADVGTSVCGAAKLVGAVACWARGAAPSGAKGPGNSVSDGPIAAGCITGPGLVVATAGRENATATALPDPLLPATPGRNGIAAKTTGALAPSSG